MKLWYPLIKRYAPILVFLLLQSVFLWTLYIPLERQLYFLGMELFVLLCMLVLSYVRKKREHERRKRMDGEAFLKLEVEDGCEQELQRMIREQWEARKDALDCYQKEKKERERYFQIWIHQIKTPLFAMKMLAEHMEDEGRKKQMRQELFKLERYTQMALNVQKLKEDHIIERCCLHELVQEALRTYRLPFIEKGLRLDFTYEEVFVYTDRKWFVFILEQLLDNALKYTMEGCIHIRCTKEGVLIRDEGCGIRSEDLPLVMKKGYTGMVGRESRQASGMGLYLVKEVCQQLHISIDITSQKGEGCCVMLKPVQESFCDK